jgi:hypothetical protein
MTDNTCAKAMIALSAGLAEVIGDDASFAVINYLIATTDGPGIDPATSNMIWKLIEVMTPPRYTPRTMLGEAFA